MSIFGKIRAKLERSKKPPLDRLTEEILADPDLIKIAEYVLDCGAYRQYRPEDQKEHHTVRAKEDVIELIKLLRYTGERYVGI